VGLMLFWTTPRPRVLALPLDGELTLRESSIDSGEGPAGDVYSR